MILQILTHFIPIDEYRQPDVYKEGRSQKLNKQEASDRNQDKKAIAADNWYLLHNFAGQKFAPASSRTSVTLAVEQAAASERYDKTCDRARSFTYVPIIVKKRIYGGIVYNNYRISRTQSPIMRISTIFGWRGKHLMKTEYASTTTSVILHGTTKPITVTK